MARRRAAQTGHSAPARAALLAFVTTERWSVVPSATGGRVRHHDTYQLNLPDGRVLRTRISRPPDGTSYGPGMWNHILREQLAVSADEFWACVHDKRLPERGQPRPVADALPADLAYQLVVTFRVPEAEVAAMSKEQAIERLAGLWRSRDS